MVANLFIICWQHFHSIEQLTLTAKHAFSNMSVQCTSVGPLCPIQASDYGYWPSLPANAFFAAIFGACAVIQIIAGMRWRAWTFMIAVAMGCTVECIGMLRWT